MFLPVNASAPLGIVGIANAQEQEQDCTRSDTRACTLAERIADPNGFVYEGWRIVRGTINILLIIALLAISFSNITRISIDTYTIKKALPNLLIGIILANASLLIIRYLADISTVVVYFFVEQASFGAPGYNFGTFISDAVGKIGLDAINVGTKIPVLGVINSVALVPVLLLVVGLIVAIGALWLALLLYIRLAFIYLLTILSPLAFVAYGIPGMDKYFRQWWQLFTKWLFMLPAMAAVFWLMLLVGRSGEGSLIQLILTYILFFTALTIPSKWGGAVINKVSNGFKNAGQLAYKGSQAGGANFGLRGMGLEARGKAISKQAEAARAADRNVEAAMLDKRAARLKARGQRGQKIGKFLVTPTSIQEGYNAKIGAQRKGREMFVEGSGAYKKLAGPDVVYANKRKKAKEEFDGLSAAVLEDKLKSKFKDEHGNPTELYNKLVGLDEDTRNKILLGSPFTSSSTAQLFGVGPNEMEDLAEVVEMYRQHSIDTRRSRRRVSIPLSDFGPGGGGAGAAAGPGGAPPGGGPGGGGAPGSGSTGSGGRPGGGGGPGSFTPPAGGAGGIRWPGSGNPPATPAAGGTPPPSPPPPTNEPPSQDLKIHLDHFKATMSPEAARDIAKFGAQVHQDINDAIDAGGDGQINQAIEKAKNFFAKAGYGNFLPPNTGEPSQQAIDLADKVSKVSQAAEAAWRNISHETATSIDTLHRQTGDQLSTLVPNSPDPAQRAQSFANDPRVNQVITNHVVQQAQLMGAQLNQQQIDNLTKSIRQGIILDITNKRTLNRIFNSEQFRQNINETISSYSASQNQPNNMTSGTQGTTSQPSETPQPPPDNPI